MEASPARTLALPDERATVALAAGLARLARRGDVIALSGPLGGGKTAFARAFISALGGAEEVPSPTFTLVQTYETPVAPVWHFDAYRLRVGEEIWELGLEEALSDGITLIEWPERVAAALPADRLELHLAPGASPQARRAALHPGPGWAARLALLLSRFRDHVDDCT